MNAHHKPNPERDAWFADAKSADIVKVAESMGVALKNAGRDRHSSCPVCGGKDGNEFILTPGNESGSQFLCRKSGEGGDVVAMVRHVHGIPDGHKGFVEACEVIMGGPPPGDKATELSDDEKRERDEARAKRQAEIAAENDQREADEAKRKESEHEKAVRIYEAGKLITGTFAAEYLRARNAAASMEQGRDLHFIADHPFWAQDGEGKWIEVGKFPAMVAAIRDPNTLEFQGCHQTYLDPTQPGKKATVPAGSKAKKIRGEAGGGVIMLGAALGQSLAIGEGIETVLSWSSLGIGPDDITLATSVSLGNLSGSAKANVLHPRNRQTRHAMEAEGRKPTDTRIRNGEPDMDRPGIVLPSHVREVFILGDGDSNKEATYATILTAARRFHKLGKTVLVHFAPDGMDWNDFVQAKAKDDDLEIPPVLTLEEFEQDATRLLRGPSRFGRVSWGSLDDPGPEHEYLVDGFMTKGDKSVIGGPSQSGKSFLAIHLGMCLARGVQFFGRDCEKTLVVYQAGEGSRGIKKRLRAYRKHFAVPSGEEVPFELLTSAVDLWAKDGDTQALITEIKTIQADWPDIKNLVFFIDTLATATAGADENSGKDMSAVMKNIDLIARATGAHVCLVHHMNAGGTKLRGHTSIYANIDQVVLVTRDEQTKIRTAVLDKQKDDESGLRVRFELLSVKIGEDTKHKPITSCVCLNVGEKAAAREDGLKGAWTPNTVERNVVNALLTTMQRHGRAPTPEERAELHIPTTVQEVVAWDEYRETIRSLEPGDTPRGADAIRKEFGRVIDKLGPEGAKVLAYSRPLMWMLGRPVKGFPSTYGTDHEADNSRTNGGHGGQMPDTQHRADLENAGF